MCQTDTYTVITRQWNNRWPWSASVTEYRGRAACVPVGEGWARRGQRRQEADCSGDTRPRRKFGRDLAEGCHPCTTTTVCSTPPRARTTVFLIEREAASELLAGKSDFSLCLANTVKPVSRWRFTRDCFVAWQSLLFFFLRYKRFHLGQCCPA